MTNAIKHLLTGAILGCFLPLAGHSQPFAVEVIDEELGWPVPLVTLRTTHDLQFVTDNAGIAVIDSQELLKKEIWFHVESDGYEFPQDGFGYRGFRARIEPGKPHRIKVKRTMLAKRLGRLTGAGLFAEAQKIGRHDRWMDTGVLGADSVQNATFQGKRYWIWGDTTLGHYPLGVFHASCATTSIRPLAKFEPPVGIRFDYLRDSKSKPRGVASMPGEGPTWLSAVTSVLDKNGSEQLVATYVKVRGFLDVYQTGLCVWDNEMKRFDRLKVLSSKSKGETAKHPPMPDGHAVAWKDDTGKDWLLFGNPLPSLRCPASFEAWQNPDTWEPLQPQQSIPVRNDDKEVTPHSGSIAWSRHLDRWVAIFVEKGGKPSPLGEVWFAEAKAPTGPWSNAVKVLSHRNYTFYNPKLHESLSPEGSPTLLFEGTYSALFARNPPKTPRYNYNQILYRLDLDDPKLVGDQDQAVESSTDPAGTEKSS